MARLSTAKSHLHPRSVGLHAAATLLRFTFVMSPAERCVADKRPSSSKLPTPRCATRYLVAMAQRWFHYSALPVACRFHYAWTELMSVACGGCSCNLLLRSVF